MPTVGELDQHLIREGRHERLWEVLGAHVRRYDTPRGTVEGVSFAVWAPNARGVKVTGDFDYWEARAYPMRSLGSSGVWEIFIPGVAGRQPVPLPRARRRRHVAGEVRPAGLRHRGAAAQRLGRHRVGARVGATTRGWPTAPSGGWHERPMSVYEVHAGSWRQGLSYRRAGRRARRLRRRGRASPTSSSCRWPSTPSAAPGATRSPPTTRRPRASAAPTTCATSSTGPTRPASA